MNAMVVMEQYSEMVGAGRVVLVVLVVVHWRRLGLVASASVLLRAGQEQLCPHPSPQDLLLRASRRLGVRPSIGIRAKLTTRWVRRVAGGVDPGVHVIPSLSSHSDSATPRTQQAQRALGRHEWRQGQVRA